MLRLDGLRIGAGTPRNPYVHGFFYDINMGELVEVVRYLAQILEQA